MSARTWISCVGAAATLLCLVSAACAAAPARFFELTVLDHEGEPITGMPFILLMGEGDQELRIKEMTDSSGRIQAEIAVPDGAQTLRIVPGLLPPAPATQDYVRAVSQRANELLASHSMLEEYAVPVPLTGQQWSYSITAKHGVRVSGRCVDAAGHPVSATIFSSGGLSIPPWQEESSAQTGVFSFGGVPRGERSEFWAMDSIGRQERIVVTAQQAVADCALGDVVFPVLRADAAALLRFTDFSTADGRLMNTSAATFVTRDLSIAVVYFVSSSEGRVVKIHEGTEPPSITAGDYYVVPGSLNDETPLVRAFVALLDEGDPQKLAGLLKVTVSETNTVETVTTFADCARRIREAAGLPPPPPPPGGGT